MSNRGNTSQLVDDVVCFMATSGLVTATVLAPNVVIALRTPLRKLYSTLDRRQREREAWRVVYYMKSQGYLAGDYEHGLQLTEKALRRLRQIQLDDLVIVPLRRWDGFWRVVSYDIPEDKKSARNAFGNRLRQMGCFQLQRSVWISPFSCREQVAVAAAHYGTDEHVTYFEARNLDNEAVLRRRFSKKYPTTKF